MKKIILLLMFTYSVANATEHVWTGVGSACGDTLNLCVDNAAENDTIILKTNEVINESLNYADVSVSLVAAEGFHPVFGIDQNIQLKNISGEIRIVGLTLLDGNITVLNEVDSGLGSRIEIVKNHVTQNAGEAITVIQKGTDDLLEIDIRFNEITVTGDYSKGIHLTPQFTGNHIWDATVYGNTVTGDSGTWGIYVNKDDSAGVFNNLISGNVMYGHTSAAIALWNQDNSTAQMSSYVVSNYSNGGEIMAQAQLATGGEMIVYVYNNTVTDSDVGLGMYGQLGDVLMEYHLVNNLIIDTDFAIRTNPPSYNVMATNETNLFQRPGGFSNYAVSGSNISAFDDEAIVQNGLSPRLVACSPAIDAATFVTAGPYVDADGLYRSKLGGIDIGAFEYGDQTFTHASTGGSYNSPITGNSINDRPGSESIHVTQNMTQGSGESLSNLGHVGIWYSTATDRWNIFNEDRATQIEAGVKFNVIEIGDSANTFEHEVAGSVTAFSLLDYTALNSQPDKILQVTQHWTGEYNDHPEGVYYNEGLNKWYIYNLDNEVIPNGANYNIQYQDASKSAWVHTSSDDNSSITATFLDNPLINGVSCAQLQVTQDATGGVFNSHPIGVFYHADSEKWLIAQQRENGSVVDGFVMPIGAQFHVLINPQQIEQCNDVIFAHSFD